MLAVDESTRAAKPRQEATEAVAHRRFFLLISAGLQDERLQSWSLDKLQLHGPTRVWQHGWASAGHDRLELPAGNAPD